VGKDEQGTGPAGRVLVAIDPRFLRPTDVDVLQGDSSKAREKLGWQPRVRFRELAKLMVEHDLRLADQQT